MLRRPIDGKIFFFTTSSVAKLAYMWIQSYFFFKPTGHLLALSNIFSIFSFLKKNYHQIPSQWDFVRNSRHLYKIHFVLRKFFLPSRVAHACNPRTRLAEAGLLLSLTPTKDTYHMQGQSGLATKYVQDLPEQHGETRSQNKQIFTSAPLILQLAESLL